MLSKRAIFVRFIFFLVFHYLIEIMYNEAMEYFIWTVVGILALYLILSFVYMHLSLDYRKKIEKSNEIIKSHLKSHISLLDLLLIDVNKQAKKPHNITIPRVGEDITEGIKYLTTLEATISALVTENKVVFADETNYVDALGENNKLLRDEIYRHNSYVQNFNIICDSLVFWPIVKILKLKKKDKY